MRKREHDCDNREHGEIASGPLNAQSFAEPEDSEGDDHDADPKLERVFGDSSKWTMDRDTQSDDYDCGCAGSQSGWNQRSRHTTYRHHYQYHFHSLETTGL